MDKQRSQEHSILENESDASSRLVRPNLAAMQLQLLPSDVLREILSRLSLKEVVRMRVLSREWRRLRICHPDLVFTKDTFSISTTWDTEHHEEMTFAELMEIHDKNLEWLTRKFIKCVDSVLRPLWSTSTTTTISTRGVARPQATLALAWGVATKSFVTVDTVTLFDTVPYCLQEGGLGRRLGLATLLISTTLNKFAVKFGLRKKYRYHIDRWVIFSTASRAKHIALDFTTDYEGCIGSRFDKYKYALPLSTLSGPNGSCVRSLYLGNVYLELPPSFCGITNLKELTLNTVSINGDDLQCLLLSCALLENFNLEWCSSLSSLCIPQELCRLQKLRVRHCKLEVIELHAPNLTKFEFDDHVKQGVLNECLKLSKATFVSNMRGGEFDDYGFDFTFTELPAALPRVHKLFLLLNVDQVLRFTDNQSRFTNLRHLNVNLDLFWDPEDTSWAMGLVNLLELAPLLEELELHLSHERFCSPAMRTAKAMQGPPHHHLKSVYMSGFCDVLGLAELALYILGNATTLRCMVVDPMAYAEFHTDDIYSVSKAGSIEGDRYDIDQNRMFMVNTLDKEEFRQILTIL